LQKNVTKSVKKEDIDFIGVGLMGHGMAKNILAAGFRMSVFQLFVSSFTP
jgi:3-hydroxyisobutyrate dehydrogenase-like beta-hydroxyacid dehydrogenase